MTIEQIYTGCLAEAAYYIESQGEVAIIDPLRETKPYTDRAERKGAKIKYILETHFHADFVSGHVDLSRKTGATIVFGPTAQPSYPAHVASDGEVLKLGKAQIKVLHTPGHTQESSCFLLIDEQGRDHAIFTGDTLFIGDVGRPDLVQKLKPEITPQYLAGLLYDSLRSKIMPLDDGIILYPGHGAGSACGKSMSNDTVDTLGHQKRTNYALRKDMTREQFIREVTEGLVDPPQYFPANVVMNIMGNLPGIDELIREGAQALGVQEFMAVREGRGALVLDTRHKEEFSSCHIPGSLYIGLDDQFAPWAGTLIPDLKHPILLVTDEGHEEEAVVRLARVGYDNAVGYLKGGVDAWAEAGQDTDRLAEITAEDFAELQAQEPNRFILLDVRRKSEYDTEHVVGAESFPLDFINRNLAMLDPEVTYYVHCAGGYRSVIACSILKGHGFDRVVNILGGFKALSASGLERTTYRKQNTAL
jgi:hydroxyacylglutathione hydrolase